MDGAKRSLRGYTIRERGVSLSCLSTSIASRNEPISRKNYWAIVERWPCCDGQEQRSFDPSKSQVYSRVQAKYLAALGSQELITSFRTRSSYSRVWLSSCSLYFLAFLKRNYLDSFTRPGFMCKLGNVAFPRSATNNNIPERHERISGYGSLTWSTVATYLTPL